MRSILSTSLHLSNDSLILGISSGTTAVATTLAPPSCSDTEFTKDTALGPLQSYIHLISRKIGIQSSMFISNAKRLWDKSPAEHVNTLKSYLTALLVTKLYF